MSLHSEFNDWDIFAKLKSESRPEPLELEPITNEYDEYLEYGDLHQLAHAITIEFTCPSGYKTYKFVKHFAQDNNINNRKHLMQRVLKHLIENGYKSKYRSTLL